MRGKLAVRLSARAGADYENITVYGLEAWGEDRTATYIAWLDREIDTLATFPEIGSGRGDIDPEVRCLPIADHVVFYRRVQDEILVTRILHHRQDASAASGI